MVALGAGRARAQTEFISKIQVYVDDDHTQVVSPVVHAQADVTPTTNVSAGYLADVVTSASIDIVTQASPSTIHDIRHQASVGVSQLFGSYRARLGYLFSVENDYLSHNVSAEVERSLRGKNTTIALGYDLSLDRVGRANDHNFERPLDVHGASLSWTQIVNPRLITQLTYEVGLSSGFQASPYRFVPVRMDPDAVPTFWVAETDPDMRYRQVIMAAANLFVFQDSAVQADYRLYVDTWGITSHTIGTRYIVGLGSRAELRLRNRFYVQSGASFYQSAYDEVERYMTIDRELGPLWSDTLGAKLTVRLSGRVEGEIKADGFYFRYPEFPLLPSRLGANVGLGVQVTY